MTQTKAKKTWGVNPTIQEIRRRLRILRNSFQYSKKFTDYDRAYGYRLAIDDTLLMISKVMKNEERCRKRKRKSSEVYPQWGNAKLLLKNRKGMKVIKVKSHSIIR